MQPMIKLEGIKKTFTGGGEDVHALRGIDLEVMPGEIYGIIGFSGAGKSTLVRCINLLERPSEGKVWVNGVELTHLGEMALRKQRRQIGMIFQLFNLMKGRTVYKNVEFPLRFRGIPKKQREEKMMNLLRIVGLENRRDAYPSMLSGGQKQRVAIARALASDPKVLLCDESTSALDPQTTQEILELLRSLNKELGITIIVITHEMAVVKQICSSLAVMEDGQIVERGEIYDVFSNPRMPITRRFIGTVDGMDKALEEILASPSEYCSRHGQLVRLSYSGQSSGQAIVSMLSRQFGIDISILYGNIETLGTKPLGRMITVLSGEKHAVDGALGALNGLGVKAEVIADV